MLVDIVAVDVLDMCSMDEMPRQQYGAASYVARAAGTTAVRCRSIDAQSAPAVLPSVEWQGSEPSDRPTTEVQGPAETEWTLPTCDTRH